MAQINTTAVAAGSSRFTKITQLSCLANFFQVQSFSKVPSIVRLAIKNEFIHKHNYVTIQWLFIK
jgi:hypothetical protein